MIPGHLYDDIQIVLEVSLDVTLMLVLVALSHANVPLVNFLEGPSEHPDISLLKMPIDVV